MNDITNAPQTPVPWVPNPSQRAVLERYAIGYRWYVAARDVGVPEQTLASWLERTEFREFGEQLRTEISQAAAPMYGAVIERAQSVLLRVKIAEGDGDIEPGDPRVKWAERILRSTLWPVLLIRGGAEPRDALQILRVPRSDRTVTAAVESIAPPGADTA